MIDPLLTADLKALSDRELGYLCDMHHSGMREVTQAESRAISEQAPHVWIARLSAPVWAKTMLGYSRGRCDEKGKPVFQPRHGA